MISQKDSIILADFVNNTGNPVFDTTLKQALAIQLEQSPTLNIVSQQHLRQSMKYLGKSADDVLTPENLLVAMRMCEAFDDSAAACVADPQSRAA